MTHSAWPLAMLLLSGATVAPAATPEQCDIRIESTLQSDGRGGTVHAEMIVHAPPEAVFHAVSRCSDAHDYLPHLRLCRERPGDEGSLLVEHEVDLGWYAPRLRYVLRAEMIPGRRISLRQVHGDFAVNEGDWELDPVPGGTRVRYRARIEAPSYIPGWLARATLTREFPRMLSELRRLCENRQRVSAHTNIFLTRLSSD